MIEPMLTHLANTLNEFLKSRGSSFQSQLADIAKVEHGNNENDLQNRILITLANIEEENVLKNNYPERKVGSNIIKERSILYLNLYILLTANFQDYPEALRQMGFALQFFQYNNKLSEHFDDGSSFESFFTLHNIGFENLNNLWTVMGGKYLPSVMYKARLAIIQSDPSEVAPVILEIESKN